MQMQKQEIINISPFTYKGFNEPEEVFKDLWSFKNYPVVETVWVKAKQIVDKAQELYTDNKFFLINGHCFMLAAVTQELLDRGLEPIYPYVNNKQLSGIVRVFELS